MAAPLPYVWEAILSRSKLREVRVGIFCALKDGLLRKQNKLQFSIEPFLL